MKTNKEQLSLLDGRVILHHGDSRDVLRTLADASIDSVVTDPPYALVSIGKRFGKAGAAPAKHGVDGLYARASAGFMGQTWDTGETAFAAEFWAEVLRVLKPGGHVVAFSGTRTYHRMACAIEDAGFEIRDQLAWAYGTGFPKSHNLAGGLGTSLKPAWEPIVLARKALLGTVAGTVAVHGTGALNIDGCRVGGTKENIGRWPANIIHDGSDEVSAAFGDAPGQQGAITGNEPSSPFANIYGDMPKRGGQSSPRGDSGSAARFFYSAKAGAEDRIGSKHPTVKPVDLMQWLCRLITPPNGVVLDPFAGTGTTGEAAWREGFSAILIEREANYCTDIRRRMALCLSGRDERRRESLKARGPVATADDLPLFGGDGGGARQWAGKYTATSPTRTIDQSNGPPTMNDL